MRSQGGCAVNLGSNAHLGVMAGGKTAADACALHHLDVLADVDGAIISVEHGALNIGTFLNKDA